MNKLKDKIQQYKMQELWYNKDDVEWEKIYYEIISCKNKNSLTKKD